MNRVKRKALQGVAKYDASLRNVQDALVRLLGQNPTATSAYTLPPAGPEAQNLRGRASRMAASEGMFNALRYGIPAAGGILGGAAIIPEIGGEESYGNQAMDLLGMGAGMYGINRGYDAIGGTTNPALNTRTARGLTTAGVGLAGLLASDAIQLLIGGGEG